MATPVFAPVTAERWADLELVMGSAEDKGKCWCACWHLSDQAFQAGLGAGNRNRLKALVDDGAVPGLLAYVDGEAAAWVGVAPRRAYDRLVHAQTFAALDDLPVWAITCFIVRPAYRGRGLLAMLVRAASDYAFGNGAPAVEAFPIEPTPETRSEELYCGTAGAFLAAGFLEVGRPMPRRPVMRLYKPADE